jgi:hypothetical protein
MTCASGGARCQPKKSGHFTVPRDRRGGTMLLVTAPICSKH